MIRFFKHEMPTHKSPSSPRPSSLRQPTRHAVWACAAAFAVGATAMAGTTERVSVNSAGQQAHGDSWVNANAVSDDGRYVVFTSTAPDLVSDRRRGPQEDMS